MHFGIGIGELDRWLASTQDIVLNVKIYASWYNIFCCKFGFGGISSIEVRAWLRGFIFAFVGIFRAHELYEHYIAVIVISC